MSTSNLTFSWIVWSSIGKKILTGITGLALIGFIIIHLIGNLLLLAPTGELFNTYAYKLHSLGPLLYVLEAGLALFFLMHAYTGINIWINKRKARPQRYAKYQSQGGASKQNLSSRSMIITGTVLLVFLVAHLFHFKFGAYYETTLAGVGTVRDLYRTVVEYYQNPFQVAGYVLVMALLGLHLRHGFWSALQSLGAMKPRFSDSLHAAGMVLGLLLSVGFIIIPIWIYIVH